MNTLEIGHDMLTLLKGQFSSLCLTYNDHSCNYQTAEVAELDGNFSHVTWPSAEEKELALSSNSVWILQWYPNTPVGFCAVGAASFAACLAFALKG
jgi:hypothetical protein